PTFVTLPFISCTNNCISSAGAEGRAAKSGPACQRLRKFNTRRFCQVLVLHSFLLFGFCLASFPATCPALSAGILLFPLHQLVLQHIDDTSVLVIAEIEQVLAELG